jgi:tartrate dehydrogenase/decarboxylase/D-malate dehydrogenase
MPGIRSPLVDRHGQPLAPGAIDMWIVRENTEGEYSNVGGRMYEGSEREIVMQQTVMSRVGVDRVLRFAFELARSRPRRKLTSATKSNGISITMPYWDERVAAMSKAYPDVTVDRFHIDILTAWFVQRPQLFDVVVASNLFGDILSDLGPACTGTIGIAPSANLNPTRQWPSLFEPVHGSAPDIAGRFVANPIGQVWSVAMMLDFLGHRDAHDAVLAAIEAVLADAAAPRTPDLGGTAGTRDLGAALERAVSAR